jgi:uncharacterized protein DUF3150
MTTATATLPSIPTASLADRALLVNLSISQWSAAKSDKKVNHEVATAHGNALEMGNYRKSLLAKEALKAVKEITARAREEHYRVTLPWRDTGDRVLSSAGYFAYAATMRRIQTEWETAVDLFCANYPQLVEEARAKLNGLFNSADYPDAAEMRGKFSFKFEVLPLPAADDFRVNLGEAEVSRIREQIGRDSAAQVNRAMADVWQRMRDVIAAMSTRLKVFTKTPDGSTAHPFRDTLVTNISDLLQVIPILNLTGDPNVTQFAAEMRDSLTKFTPDQLRNAEYARTDTAARADEILAKMAAFIA